jgi:ribosomal protein S18 acetylase RimI-like enzyme
MEIRTANLEDLCAIETLWKEMMLFHSALDDDFSMIPEAEEIHREYMKGILQEGEKRVLVADDGGIVLGYIRMETCKKPPIYPNIEYVEIKAISVSTSARRKGIGRKLVEAVTTWCMNRNIMQVECGVAVNNPVSQAFWKRMGFRATIERCKLDLR